MSLTNRDRGALWHPLAPATLAAWAKTDLDRNAVLAEILK